MTRLSYYIEKASDKSRLALAATGVLATLLATTPYPAEAGNFLDKVAGHMAGRPGRAYPVDDVRTAAAFNVRSTDNLTALVDLSRALRRNASEIFGNRFSGYEKADKIKTAYLYEYSRASFPELRQYDRLLLSVAPGVHDRRVALIVDDSNKKKNLLRDGTTIVDELAQALVREDYRSAERLINQLEHMMERRAVPLLEKQREHIARAENNGIGFSFGR
jgi:hypothetical protein